MKLSKITFVLLLATIICYVAAAAPNLDYLTEDDCRGCHGDENGKTVTLHHEQELNCTDCHGEELDFPDDWRDCYNCHTDFDHHEDAQGRCSDCHDDKQKNGQKGRHN